MKTGPSIVIILLAVAVAVLGYLYYQSSRDEIVIQIPHIEIKP